jgi:polyisoprenoid-binding protein YceI
MANVVRLLVVLGLAFCAPVALAATQWTVDTAASKVDFVAEGNPGFLKIEGTGAQLSGDVVLAPTGDYLGLLTVSLKPVKTGIGLRDEHMHGKYLETTKYPTATLKLKEGLKGTGGKFCGTLTVKAKAKDVCGEATVADVGGAKHVKASFTLNIADFPIGVPSHLGVTVAETVGVTVEAVAKPKL